jgi:hypothetical protein
MPYPKQPSRGSKKGAQLPEELATYLKDVEYAALLHGTDHGGIYICKAPRRAIEQLRGPLPIGLTHSLYDHPNAPVIQSVIRLYDQPHSHLALETYVNVAADGQREDFASLGRQRSVALAFYNERLDNQLTKRIPNSKRDAAMFILFRAMNLSGQIPADRYDFDRAKEAVIAATTL